MIRQWSTAPQDRPAAHQEAAVQHEAAWCLRHIDGCAGEAKLRSEKGLAELPSHLCIRLPCSNSCLGTHSATWLPCST